MNQINTLPVNIFHPCHLHYYMENHWRSLSHIHPLHQVTLPVQIPQVFQIPPQLTSHRRSLSQLYHLHQVPLPVDTPHAYHIHYHMTYHGRVKVPPPNLHLGGAVRLRIQGGWRSDEQRNREFRINQHRRHQIGLYWSLS